MLEVVARARYEDRWMDKYRHEQSIFACLEVPSEARRLIAEGDVASS